MRSLPSYLVVSRREVDDDREVIPDYRPRRDDPSDGEFRVTIAVSYKTLAIIFLIFNVVGHIIDSLTGADLSRYSEKLTSLLPF